MADVSGRAWCARALPAMIYGCDVPVEHVDAVLLCNLSGVLCCCFSASLPFVKGSCLVRSVCSLAVGSIHVCSLLTDYVSNGWLLVLAGLARVFAWSLGSWT
jgi:hypothetical protein